MKRCEVVFDVEFYRLPDGSAPVEDFLRSLEPKMRVKAVNSIALLEEFGYQLREPHSKAPEDGLFELRVKFASDITRIFCFFRVGNKIILTNGFIKKTNKTPTSEKDLAKKYKSDDERRCSHE